MVQVIKGRGRPAHQYGPGIEVKVSIDGDAGARNVSAGWAAFEPGSKTDVHTRPVEEVIFVTKGQTTIVAEGQEYTLSEGDAMFIPPGIGHSHENRGTQSLEHIWMFAPQGPEAPLRELPVVST